MGPFISAGLAVASKIGGWLLRSHKRLSAEKSAAALPRPYESVDAELFDHALQRISQPNDEDPLFTRFSDAIAREFYTPAFLRTANVQAWLSSVEVRSWLHNAAALRLQGAVVDSEVLERLEVSYRTLALASTQESKPVVDSILALLTAAVHERIADKGTAALVVTYGKEIQSSLDRVHARLDGSIQPAERLSPKENWTTPVDEHIAESWRASFLATSDSLLEWPSTVGSGSHVTRPELEQLVARVAADEHGTVALLGVPGAGKSALLAGLGRMLRDKAEVEVLGIKADLLGDEVRTEEGLRQALNLPELPSTMLARFALSRPTVLLIDQLDALAGHLDTKTGRLSVLLNLIKSLSDVQGLHVFVSCRTFEYEHDVRLSKIDAQGVVLELPDWEVVLPILEAHGVTAAGWNKDAREVLRVPQQLGTYLQLRLAGVDEPVSNYTAMLDRLWTTRVLDAPGAEDTASLAFEIAELMADKEMLWLAKPRFEQKIESVRRLISTGLLVENARGAIGFSHQTVFEHVLARSFTKNDGRLSAYVRERKNSLYVRPKLWAALGYIRSVEPATYEAELTAIWSAPETRKHIRFLIIEFLGSQSQPSDKEELLLVRASEAPEYFPLVLKAVSGSKGWFERLAGNLVSAGMSLEKTADLCVPILNRAWEHDAPSVEQLLRERWLNDSANDRRVMFVLENAPVWNAGLVDMFKIVAGRSPLSASNAEYLLGTIGATNASVAIELLHFILTVELPKRLKESLALKQAAEADMPADGEPDVTWHLKHRSIQPLDDLLDENNWGYVPSLALAAPQQFLASLWPWYDAVFRHLSEMRAPDEPNFGYPLRYQADFQFKDEATNGLGPGPLLEALVVAVEAVAIEAPSEIISWADSSIDVALTPVQRLIAHALAHNPSETSARALTFLLADERRYFLGGMSDGSSTTLALVTACSPFWSAADVEAFTNRVNEYSPPRPSHLDSASSIKQWGRFVIRTRRNLLRALATTARSPDVQRAVEEADRASPQRTPDLEIQGGWIGPRMDAAQFARASVDDIVNAFREIPDEAEWDHPKRHWEGGNVQLARSFADFARSNHVRAIEVIHRLEPSYAQRATGYALIALAEGYDANGVMALVIELDERGFNSDEYNSSVVDAVSRLVKREVLVSEPVLKLVEGKLVGSAEPAVSDDEPKKSNRSEGFLLTGHPGIEVVPGGDYPILSLLVEARLLRGEVREVVELLRDYLRVSKDRRIWSHLTISLSTLPSLSPEHGPDLIGEVLSLEQLDGSRGAAILMAHTHQRALEQVLQNLSRWRDSSLIPAQRGYGELVALIALTNPLAHQARAWLEELVHDPALVESRAGAASMVANAIWHEPKYREASTALLAQLIAMGEADVWHQVFSLFGTVEKLEPEPHTVSLLTCIADNIHQAPAPAESYVLERLGTILPRHAMLVARISTHLADLWKENLTNIGSSLVSAGLEMMNVAMTLHLIDETRVQGLELFEQLVEIDAYQAREVLDELDHRLRIGSRPIRPRLKRMSRSRRRLTKMTPFS